MRKIVVATAALIPVLTVALGAVVATAHELSWERAHGGAVPHGAIAYGRERSGESLFVCRAEHAEGLHIGKIRAEFGGCNIPYGGNEIVKATYEILVYR